MNTIFSPKQGDPENDRTSEERIEKSIPPQHHEVNITYGGEFLDDAIRMNDQPFGETAVKKKEQSYSPLFFEQHF